MIGRNQSGFTFNLFAAISSLAAISWCLQADASPSAGLALDYYRTAIKRTVGSVVPRPKSIVYQKAGDSPAYLEIDPKKLRVKNLLVSPCPVVSLAVERYTNFYLFDDIGPESKDDVQRSQRRRVGQLEAIELVGSANFNCELIPPLDMDEAYNLTMRLMTTPNKFDSFELSLNARSSWGLLRALETLSQLIFNIKSVDGSASIFAINLVRVEDEPRFKHRGFMLDTARHYIPVEKILELLDAMAMDKLNVFHWHMVDDQSFPYVSKLYPQLSGNGSFRPRMIYTPEDVKLVIFCASIRGIRVVPEIDTPGHMYSMRHIPNLLSECYDPKTGEKNGDVGPIDPTSENSYEVMNNLLAELGTLFRDPYFFAGGDEVEFDCWRSSPTINKWLEARNLTGNYTELSNYYMRQLYQVVKRQHKTMVVWQEVFDMGANMPQDTVISVWKYINDVPAFMAQLARVVERGYQALLSSCWYLNYIDYGEDWIKFYNCDPRSHPIKPEHEHLVLGGEICMWTEFVDKTNVMSRTWPRASAAAERLWSPKDANNTQEFLHRLEQHRCRLLSRGLQVEPVNGPGYC